MSLASLLAELDGAPASYLRVAPKLADHAAELGPPRTIAWLASFTTELLGPYLTVEGARKQLHVTPYFAPFGQIEQPLLDAESALYQAKPELIVIAVRLEDTRPALVDGWLSLPAEHARALVDEHVARLASAVRAARARSKARILVWNQMPLARLAAGLADPTLAPSQSEMIVELNRALARAVGEVADAYVFDAHRLATELGTTQLYDAKLGFLARMPFSAKAQIAIAQATIRQARAMWRPPCKCLVVDLDNTLWGGVIGEDGVGGIKLGQDYPGSAFVAFQRRLLAYRDRGVLLAIASKNNPADVDEAFAHASMVLKPDDFVARQIHWNDKGSSLRAIAAELNIGIDSLAFFDDNPVERDWVRREVPEVTVIDVPTSPLGYVDALDQSGAFDLLTITAEDRERTKLYQTDAARTRLAEAAGSVEDFLRQLGMRITIGAVGRETLPRVVQLLGKTNQFNVTTRRHSQADLEAMIAEGAIALWMRVEDRFGDNGLVGVAIARPRGEVCELDSFLMSCRVLGRKAEAALLDSIVRRARARGARTLLGEFIPTKKNAPAKDFFANAGFTAVDGEPGRWRLPLVEDPPPPTLFELIEVS
jgi:FkbH-like protein